MPRSRSTKTPFFKWREVRQACICVSFAALQLPMRSPIPARARSKTKPMSKRRSNLSLFALKSDMQEPHGIVCWVCTGVQNVAYGVCAHDQISAHLRDAVSSAAIEANSQPDETMPSVERHTPTCALKQRMDVDLPARFAPPDAASRTTANKT